MSESLGSGSRARSEPHVAIISGLSGAGKTAASKLLEDVGSDAAAAVEAEAARLAAWLGDVRVAPGFLPPFQRALAR